MNAEPPACNIYEEGERARCEKLYQTRGYNGVKKSLHSSGFKLNTCVPGKKRKLADNFLRVCLGHI